MGYNVYIQLTYCMSRYAANYDAIREKSPAFCHFREQAHGCKVCGSIATGSRFPEHAEEHIPGMKFRRTASVTGRLRTHMR